MVAVCWSVGKPEESGAENNPSLFRRHDETLFRFFPKALLQRRTSSDAARRVARSRPRPRVAETAMHVLSVPSTDGVVLQVQDRGVWYPPSAPSSSHLEGADAEAPVTMLLVHANGFHGRVFDPLVDALRAGAASRGRAVRIVTFDMRAHGASTPPRVGEKTDTLRWDRFADDVLAAARTIREGLPDERVTKNFTKKKEKGNARARVHAVGHSLGAHAALRAEARAPGTFASIYAFEPIFMLGPEDAVPRGVFSPDLARAASRRRETFASRAAAAATFASKPPMRGFHRGALAAYVEHGFVDFVPDEFVFPKTATVTDDASSRKEAPSSSGGGNVRLAMRRDDEALVFALGARETEAMRSVCAPGAVSCPVTIARGSTRARHDPTLTPYPAFVAGVLAERMGKETARRLETRSGWDHFAPVADPGGFAERVWNHVAEVARDSRAEESRSRTERTRVDGENEKRDDRDERDRVSRRDARSRL
jgi:pimeloyl-ACP methyl ester carboxylesterase